MSLAALIALGIAAQQTPAPHALTPGEVSVSSRPYRPSYSMAVDVNRVDVEVVVRDADGRTVGGLPQSAFTLLDNGVPQKITYFALETPAPAVADEEPAAPAAVSPAAANAPQPAPPPQVAPPPRSVALYFDDLHSESAALSASRTAAEGLMKTGMGATDQVGVFTASNTTTLPFTSDRSAVLKALGQLRPHIHMDLNGLGMCPRITPEQAYAILAGNDPGAYSLAYNQAYQCNCVDMQDLSTACRNAQKDVVTSTAQTTWNAAVVQSQDTLDTLAAALNALARQPGSRTLVIASAGYLTYTLEADQDALIAGAIHDGIVINALDAKGLVASYANGQSSIAEDLPGSPVTGRGSDDSYRTRMQGRNLISYTDSMAALAEGTGGRLFWNNNDLRAGYQQLAAAPAVAYLLGFAPASAKGDTSFHKLAVKLDSAGHLDVQARRGYFARPAAPQPVVADDPVADMVRSSESRTELPVEIATSAQAGGVEVVARLDVHGLSFHKQADRNLEQITFVSVLVNAGGTIVAGKLAVMDLKLTDASLQELLASGIRAQMQLSAPPGDYRLREVVREADAGKIAAASFPVEVH